MARGRRAIAEKPGPSARKAGYRVAADFFTTRRGSLPTAGRHPYEHHAIIHCIHSIAGASVLAIFGLSAQAQTVQIAIAGPMSGSVAQYGDMVKAGVLTAIEQINAAGGAGG